MKLQNWSMSMYNIDQEYLSLMEHLLEAEGEVDDATMEAFTGVEAKFEHKVGNYVGVIRMLSDMESTCDAQIERIKRNKERAARAVARLKEQLHTSMELRELDKVDLGTAVVSFRKAEAVEIEDEHLIPDKFLNKKLTITPDKTAIKAHIKAGNKVDGAELVTRKHIQIK